MCENYFLETETKYLVVNLAFAAILIRPGYLLDSIIARKVAAPEFLHSLGQQRKSGVSLKMSPVGGKPEVDFGRLNVSL